MNLKKVIHRRFNKTSHKIAAVYLALLVLFDAIYPTCAWALTGGPSQPEVQSFEPVGTSDMVDLFSGDFNYNIPLLDIDGYPINIAYHSGITMDQEASWVGLGWNINPGVINRNMRGIPDDFDGDLIKKHFNIKDNKTYGVNTGAGIEIFGTSKLKLGISQSIGIRYNNYNGLSIEKSLSLSLSAGKAGSSPFNGSLGINSSSDDGLTLQPSVGISASICSTENKESVGIGASVGTSFNSRTGLKSLTISGSVTASKEGNKEKNEASISNGQSVSSTFDFGMPTYTPQINMSVSNFSAVGSFKLGLEMYSVHPNFTVGGFYSAQKLIDNNVENPAYGYLNSHNGEAYDNAVLDFNREKDGIFNKNTPALPITNFTYDIYSVSGQGVAGSYRPFRSDIGHVFDAESHTTSDNFSLSGEVGAGNLWHVGVDLAETEVNSTSGRWKDDNDAINSLSFKGGNGDPLYEPYYFKEANEKSVESDPSFFVAANKFDAKRVNLNTNVKYHAYAENNYYEGDNQTPLAIPSNSFRKKRDRRGQNISVVKHGDLVAEGLENKANLYPAPDHHIAEITTLRTDGARYVYGIAAYNTNQQEVSFAIGTNLNGGGYITSDAGKGTVNYNSGTDDGTGNTKGLDNFYSNTEMPAYAHSYLLTAVLSPDYIDCDNTKGPSDGDFGNYTKFDYEKINNYNWKVPLGAGIANYNEGLKSITYDDKGNYVYGTKELWYLKQIETKNYIAKFDLEARADANGVTGKNGQVETSPLKASKLLRKISLFSKKDYQQNPTTAKPIKVVHFEYDYSRCPGVPNFNSAAAPAGSVDGKLTLRKIFFTYQNSHKGRFSPYTFDYTTPNPSYNVKGYDRWGNYKFNNVTSIAAVGTGFGTAEFPYTEQNKTDEDNYAQAWTLNKIKLPSGGIIDVSYESDDYASVQNKKAMEMYKVVGVSFSSTGIINPPKQTSSTLAQMVSNLGTLYQPTDISKGDPRAETYLIVKFDNPITTGTFLENYLANMNFLYFRFLASMKPNKYEYVSGYVPVDESNIRFASCVTTTDGQYGCITLNNVSFADDNAKQISPMTKAAIQFGRLNLSREVWGDDLGLGDNESFGAALLKKIVASSFIKNMIESAKGPNKALFDKNVGRSAVMGKSFVRLNNANNRKLGGGCRVTKITLSDDWNGMTAGIEQEFDYGQEYTYTNEDGLTSSGVASYEPQIGGDENPWKQPVFFETKYLLAPDDNQYMEEPFGECFFPNPSVGYGRVTVKNLKRKATNGNVIVKAHATGKTVHEFYTTKDFPTIVDRTDLAASRDKTSPISLRSLLRINVKDYMTTSQGYVIELNDMNGKPKSKKVYPEGDNAAIISSVTYNYKSIPYNGASRLENTVKAVYPDGSVDPEATVGLFFDMVSDMRESKTTTIASSINTNIDDFLVGVFPIPIPMIIPSRSKQYLQFRSAVVTKVIQRFGILEETIAFDQGSTISARNLAYDSETGEVIETETQNNFNDKQYTLTYPAHWYYDGMGAAYRNINYSESNLYFNNGESQISNASIHFCEGDELVINGHRVWVSKVTPNTITCIEHDGTPIDGGPYTAKVVRSGRTNQINAPMANITSFTDPLASLQSNAYQDVLQASATEYTNKSRTFCELFTHTGSSGRGDYSPSTNPYIIGSRSMWKVKKTYLHLSGRNQSYAENNTNIRKDGVLTSYSPYYRLFGGKWDKDAHNWTYTNEVTEFSPYSAELENRDALGIPKAATYGYKNSLPTAVASNSRYRDIGVENFEDHGFSEGIGDHFQFRNAVTPNTTAESHTGRYSRKITEGNSLMLTRSVAYCPLEDCGLKSEAVLEESNKFLVLASSGSQPYSFDWEVINGDPSIELISPTKLSLVKNSMDFIAKVTITDSYGCKRVEWVKSQNQ